MPQEYLAALKAYAYQDGVSLAEFVRGITHDLILKRSAGFRESSAGFEAFVNAVKLWVLRYHECVAVAGALPGKERRAELEKLTSEAVKKAYGLIQTEDAANNAKHQILAVQSLAL